MREILRAARERDAEVVAWLEVIDQFDHAVAAKASLEELVRLAGDITGRTVGARDEERARLEVADGVMSADAAAGEDIVHAAGRRPLRGRNASEIATPRGPALVAPIQVAAGATGLAWLVAADGRAWAPVDFLVVERLARSVAMRALAARKQRSGTPFDAAAVERLLCGELSEDELTEASWHARLSLTDRYVAIALDQRPAGAVEAEALAMVAEQAIAEHGLAARGAVIGRAAAVVARAGEALPRALQDLTAADRLGFTVRAGVGDATDLRQLPLSWGHAREALALEGMLSAESGPAYFDQLGILHLLAQIPTQDVLESELLRRMSGSLGHDTTPSDLDVLEAYLAEGTLRLAGNRVFLHHTTVQHRLKRIEGRLGADLRDPQTHFEIQLALKLLAIVRARGAPSR